MSLTKKQFLVLEFLMENAGKGTITQREIAGGTEISLGGVNKIINELTTLNYIDSGRLTETGVNALESYRVRRAIFIAAGFGSRLVPVSLNTPKPLVRVKGQRIIDSLLDAVVAAEIEEIYIVRGYLAEQFDQLLYKYPMIKFIQNPLYNESNNISSVLTVGDLLGNSYVLEADLLLYNPKLIKKYQYESNYLGVPVKKTDDWCFVTENDIIKDICVGGLDCYHMFGISYWTEADGTRLPEHVRRVFESPGGKERYWDQVALQYFKDDYQVHVRTCSFDDIVEIDTFSELKKIDGAYCV